MKIITISNHSKGPLCSSTGTGLSTYSTKPKCSPKVNLSLIWKDLYTQNREILCKYWNAMSKAMRAIIVNLATSTACFAITSVCLSGSHWFGRHWSTMKANMQQKKERLALRENLNQLKEQVQKLQESSNAVKRNEDHLKAEMQKLQELGESRDKQVKNLEDDLANFKITTEISKLVKYPVDINWEIIKSVDEEEISKGPKI